MNSFEDIQTKDQQFVMGTYGRYPVALSHGQGTTLYDYNGKAYLDLLSGIAVCSLGHNHPAVTEAVRDQLGTLTHCSNLFFSKEQPDLAEKLTATWREGSKAFFCNSGAEANEAAIKLARRYMQRVKENGAYEVVTLSGSFHGRTMATLTATGQDHVKDGFSPLPEGFVTVPHNDLPALEQAISDKTAAVMLEVVQGEYGVRAVSQEYADGVQDICRKNGVLLIVDEVQTGMCRTGKFWAHEHFGIEPDIITVAKPLGGGLPMGAVLATGEVARAFTPGSHGTTFGGGPVACRAAMAVIDVMLEENLAQRAAGTGAYALKLFGGLAEKHPDKIAEVRGLGLMVGIELKDSGQEIWEKLLEQGFILNLTKGTILRLLPPLIIEKEELERFAKALDGVL